MKTLVQEWKEIHCLSLKELFFQTKDVILGGTIAACIIMWLSYGFAYLVSFAI